MAQPAELLPSSYPAYTTPGTEDRATPNRHLYAVPDIDVNALTTSSDYLFSHIADPADTLIFDQLEHEAISGNTASWAVEPAEANYDMEAEPKSLQLLHESFKSRSFAELHPGVRGEEQAAVRASVRHWMEQTYPDMLDRDEQDGPRAGGVEDYNAISADRGHNMLSALVDYLKTNHANAVSDAELEASEDFLAANFSIQEDVRNGVDLSMGKKDTHAFVVPVRLSTRNPEYSDEIRPLVPAFHYVDDELVSYFMRDMPTFVADEYENGGYLVVAPITADMKDDLLPVTPKAFLELGRARVNAAVATGRALGARAFGYGATLPGLMNWGKATADKEAVTTTGHGGTTALMCMMIDEATERFLDGRKPRIGALGLGTIGLSATVVLADRYAESQVNVFDPETVRMDNLSKGAEDRYTMQASAEEVVRNSDIIISTATTTFNLTDPTHPNYLDIDSLKGKVFIDDSEPHSFNPHEVQELGGIVLDVIGRSYGDDHVVRRTTDFGYGHTLADGVRDAFGCELEVATLNRLRSDLEAAGHTPEEVTAEIGKYALRGSVTTDHTNRWIELFKRYNIGPAPLQAFGQVY